MSIQPINLIKGIYKKINSSNATKTTLYKKDIQNVLVKNTGKNCIQKVVPIEIIDRGIQTGLGEKLLPVLGLTAVGGYSANKAIEKGQRVFSTTA